MDLTAKTHIKVREPSAEVFDAVVDPAKMSNYFTTSGSARMETGRKDGWEKSDAGIASLAEQMQGWTQFMCGLKAFVEHGINLRTGAY
jgi:hypothetical protein